QFRLTDYWPRLCLRKSFKPTIPCTDCCTVPSMPNDTLPILYSFRRCPFAMRARLALAISQTRCELREVVLRDKPAELLQASAKGTVPVLVHGAPAALDGAVQGAPDGEATASPGAR